MATKASTFEIRNPCHLDWTKMTPADGGRFCGDCKKVVKDLSAMSEAEAHALVSKPRYEGLCIRMLVDRDGNVFFGGDKLVSASLLSKAKRAAVAAAALALPLASNACTAITEPLGITEPDPKGDDLQPFMGDVAYVEPETPAGFDSGSEAAATGDAQSADANPDAAEPADAGFDANVYK